MEDFIMYSTILFLSFGFAYLGNRIGHQILEQSETLSVGDTLFYTFTMPFLFLVIGGIVGILINQNHEKIKSFNIK